MNCHLSDLSNNLARQTDLKVVNLFQKSSFSELNLILQKFFNFIVGTFIRENHWVFSIQTAYKLRNLGENYCSELIIFSDKKLKWKIENFYLCTKWSLYRALRVWFNGEHWLVKRLTFLKIKLHCHTCSQKELKVRNSFHSLGISIVNKMNRNSMIWS